VTGAQETISSRLSRPRVTLATDHHR